MVQANAVFQWRAGGREVLLTGDFVAWAELLPLRADPATGVHRLACCLPPGTYSYQFLVDGAWALCPESPSAATEDGRMANRCRQFGEGWGEGVWGGGGRVVRRCSTCTPWRSPARSEECEGRGGSARE